MLFDLIIYINTLRSVPYVLIELYGIRLAYPTTIIIQIYYTKPLSADLLFIPMTIGTAFRGKMKPLSGSGIYPHKYT